MPFIVEMRNSADTDNPRFAKAETGAEASRIAHAFFLEMDFELRPRPGGSSVLAAYDAGNDDGKDPLSGYRCFSGVILHTVDGERLVRGFVHCGGSGPTCTVRVM